MRTRSLHLLLVLLALMLVGCGSAPRRVDTYGPRSPAGEKRVRSAPIVDFGGSSGLFRFAVETAGGDTFGMPEFVTAGQVRDRSASVVQVTLADVAWAEGTTPGPMGNHVLIATMAVEHVIGGRDLPCASPNRPDAVAVELTLSAEDIDTAWSAARSAIGAHYLLFLGTSYETDQSGAREDLSGMVLRPTGAYHPRLDAVFALDDSGRYARPQGLGEGALGPAIERGKRLRPDEGSVTGSTPAAHAPDPVGREVLGRSPFEVAKVLTRQVGTVEEPIGPTSLPFPMVTPPVASQDCTPIAE